MSSDDSPPIHQSLSVYSIQNTYSTVRDTLIDTLPFGQGIWDGIRITVWVSGIIAIAILLTGVTSPIVSVTSGSMEPNINTNDLVIMTEYDPSDPPILATGDGIIAAQNSPASHKRFGASGSVIIFQTPDDDIPIMHRAQMQVEAGENWVARGEPRFSYNSVSCDEIRTCPAKTDGYITAGDNNERYDQLVGMSVVESGQVRGIVRYRIPLWGTARDAIELMSHFKQQSTDPAQRHDLKP